MRRALLITTAFLLSAVVGPSLLLLVIVSADWIWLRMHAPAASGIGAVAGGISEVAVMAVPILFGIIGALVTSRRRISNRRS